MKKYTNITNSLEKKSNSLMSSFISFKPNIFPQWSESIFSKKLMLFYGGLLFVLAFNKIGLIF